MSLLGAFTFNNNDRTVETAGPGTNTRRPSQSWAEPEYEEAPRSQSFASARSVRRNSVRDATQKTHEKTGSESDSTAYGEPKTPKEHQDAEKLGQDYIDSSEEEDRRRETEVHALARKLTSHSNLHHDVEGANPFEAEPGSILDPNSETFSARAWTKALLHLQSRDPEKYPQRTAGLAFKNLNVHGFGNETDYQKSVGNTPYQIVGLGQKVLGMGKRKVDILRDFEGVVESGEMLVVLGPPGSGCSTFLKTIAGETHGLYVDSDSYLNYQGVSAKDMQTSFRGEAIYTAEVDVHFPMMTVGDTLAFAARARAPRHLPGGVKRSVYAEHMRDVIMAMFGISHTVNTRVGNDFVRGVSGGERKRVTIAEAALSQAPLQCWDNSTRGLDSANAIEFCKTLRMETDLLGATAAVAIYQAPQNAYDIFDKVLVLYEGRQIFFGRADRARSYFEELGFEAPDRATTADFCTSMTSPAERVVRPGFEDRAPRTPDEFAKAWKESKDRADLMVQIDAFDKKYTIGGEYLDKFKESRKAQQAKAQRIKSPYTLSYVQQVQLCLWRGFVRLKGDPSLTFTQLFANFLLALVIGSVFYNLPSDTSSFFSRGSLLFFAILMNAFGSALEILTLYAQRPIVEKHSRYALYHPSAEAFASMLTDMPYKVLNAIFFNLTIYFMTNLRREPGAFFFFLLISFTLTLAMSMLFRTIASVSRTLAQAMAPAALLILAIVIYTGFVIPTPYLLGWSRWINYIDLVAYGFESLMINEFTGRDFNCAAFVPFGEQYMDINPLSRVCSTVGSMPGSSVVNGDAFIESSYGYNRSHKWRNYGILIVFVIGLGCAYLAATEYVSAKKSKGEVLVFRRGHTPKSVANKKPGDIENGKDGGIVQLASTRVDHKAMIQEQTAVFHWRDVCYDIKIKGKERRILDHVDGWVKPGTLTALMGVSGAGKTTLLDVLATRYTMGVVSGEMLVDGRDRDASFQRKTGYVQQQDLHLSTTTVREALNFSALLRQPAHISKKDKLAYVDEVIALLDMDEYADAVVGVPGEGLNVEQRKRLTIGVELAAKPELLIFLDEPTSGLDSQTSWTICNLMEKLARDSQQAVLFTIHQPSAILFQRFDRLLFLARGGKTVYFGEIGQNSQTMIDYFEKQGGFPCPKDANPAEWMLEVIGAAPGSSTDIDWHEAWRASDEYKETHAELDRLKAERPEQSDPSTDPNDKASYREFAASFPLQFWEVTKRVFEQYWRTPSYIFSKTALCVFSGLFIGFSFFNVQNSQQGLQNQLFAMFMLLTIFGQLVQQIMPHFVTQRALYEVRERPSKTYSWKAFMLSNMLVEIPWQTLMAVLIYFCWYYPIGFYRNAEPTDAVAERGALMFLFVLTFLLFTSTFAHMVIAAIDTAETGGNIASLMFSLCLVFCGVLATPAQFPRFWIFMYRLSPFTYLVSGLLSTAVAGTTVECADNEFLRFLPNSGTCGEYMQSYIDNPTVGGGYLLDNNTMGECAYCQISSTDTFLAQVNIYYRDAWRNFGLMWVYIAFNVVVGVGLYWLVRMPKNKKEKKAKKE